MFLRRIGFVQNWGLGILHNPQERFLLLLPSERPFPKGRAKEPRQCKPSIIMLLGLFFIGVAFNASSRTMHQAPLVFL